MSRTTTDISGIVALLELLSPSPPPSVPDRTPDRQAGGFSARIDADRPRCCYRKCRPPDCQVPRLEFK